MTITTLVIDDPNSKALVTSVHNGERSAVASLIERYQHEFDGEVSDPVQHLCDSGYVINIDEHEVPLPELVPDVEGGRITYTGAAWEYFYSVLEDYTKRKLGVVINGELELQLVAIHDAGSTEDGWVAGVEFDKADHDWTGECITLPLYEDSEPTITWIHVL